MKTSVKYIVLLLFYLFMCKQGFPQTATNGMTGIVDLHNSRLFVNITKVSFTADNEKYYPCLFTIEFPNSLVDYWYNLNRRSEYIFKFEKSQFVLVFDDAIWNDEYTGSLSYLFELFKDNNYHEISKDSADRFLNAIQTHSFERNAVMDTLGFGFNSVQGNGRYYITIKDNVVFVFYNIQNIDILKIITSFIIIRPHTFEIK